MGFGGGIGRLLSRLPILAVLIISVTALAVAASPQPAAADAEEQAFLGLINQHRAANGLGPLSLNSQLNDVAVWMSRDMAGNNYFSHTDSLGRDPFQRMEDFGYTYNTWKGENLAAGVETAQAAFDLFKDSPGHNANMLNGSFTVIGIARAYGAGTTFGWYWATEFGGQGPLPPAEPPAPPLEPTPLPPAPLPAPPPPPAQTAPTESATPAAQNATPQPSPAPTPTSEATPQPAAPPREVASGPPSWREIASLVRPTWERLMVLDGEGSMLRLVSYTAERYLALTRGAFVTGDVPPTGLTLGVAVPGQL